jgi:hypothetical protein
MKPTSFAALAAALTVLTAGPSLADPAQNTTAAAPPASSTTSANSAHDPNKMICKSEIATGSRLGGHKVCRTRAEWADIARDARDQLDNVNIRSDQMNPQGH